MLLLEIDSWRMPTLLSAGAHQPRKRLPGVVSLRDQPLAEPLEIRLRQLLIRMRRRAAPYLRLRMLARLMHSGGQPCLHPSTATAMAWFGSCDPRSQTHERSQFTLADREGAAKHLASGGTRHATQGGCCVGTDLLAGTLQAGDVLASLREAAGRDGESLSQEALLSFMSVEMRVGIRRLDQSRKIVRYGSPASAADLSHLALVGQMAQPEADPRRPMPVASICSGTLAPSSGASGTAIGRRASRRSSQSR